MKLLTLSGLMLFMGGPFFATRPPSQQSANTPNAQADSEAAKAAARKKRFEEEKQRLEGKATEQAAPPACSDGKPVLYITPAEASMLVGESRGFALFDTDGHKLTTSAEWSVSNSSIVELTPGADPTVTAKSEGTFTVTARMDTRTAEATVKIYPGNSLPIGTARWKVAPIPCSKGGISKVVPAVPH